MTALQYYKKYSKAQLVELDEQIRNDPESKNTDGGIYLHTKVARKKLDAIAQAITWHMKNDRAAKGDPVSQAGYSGRKSNRRR